jgi:hypothetical protein
MIRNSRQGDFIYLCFNIFLHYNKSLAGMFRIIAPKISHNEVRFVSLIFDDDSDHEYEMWESRPVWMHSQQHIKENRLDACYGPVRANDSAALKRFAKHLDEYEHFFRAFLDMSGFSGGDSSPPKILLGEVSDSGSSRMQSVKPTSKNSSKPSSMFIISSLYSGGSVF